MVRAARSCASNTPPLTHRFHPPLQEKQVLHGVEISGSAYLARAEVAAAAEFAAKAHAGQMRRTGDPYIMHCVETACIVEGLLSELNYKEDDER